MDITPETTIQLFMLVIYLIIMYVFDRARKKFKGGNIETVIKLVITSTCLLLMSDYTPLLGFLGADLVYSLHALFRLSAMCALAFGGMRLIVH